ncbi:M15 family metallopeptidase [Sphingomonas jatrophae]|uniref:D-alanyl-D-alanine carboxypeptidase n=1 Tax=Sphingomonas jatrophae TaxID=1166337 RepID=A0A1I6K5J3_9SPHN|nr:M15 family metallopeptidase [Sphingomonas jatrophae]SFR86348.1 D-alanyl-D-alanine carboxypeptidase [Sphingomonas jatrophae]
MGMLKRYERLEGVDLKLAAAIRTGVSRLTFDCTVAEGVRSKEQMWINYGKGRTAAECRAKGVPEKYAMPGVAKVTWLSNPLASNHADGRAVDVYPLVRGQLANTRDHLPLFRALYEAIMAAGREVGVRLRYGGDWDQDGKLFEKGETDAVHFERAA